MALLTIKPNTTSNTKVIRSRFNQDLKYCMNFDEELIKLFEQNFQHYNQFIEDISANNNAPHCYSVFLCRKL